MNAVEERIRAAIRAAGDTVHEVRPLPLPPEPGTARGLRSGARARRARIWRTWMAPVAAAAAVLAVGVALVVVRDIPNGGVPSASRSAAASPQPTASAAPAALPRYYVALDDTLKTNSPWAVVVGDTFTGARLATVSPPAHGTFAGMTGAADDRTFVLDATTCFASAAASRLCPRTWYLLRLSPGSASPARLTRLPIPPTASGTQVQGIALSPDGSELAVALQPAGSVPESLSVYAVATGAALRTWTGPSGTIADPGEWPRADSNSVLFWSADGRTLSFRNETNVRMLRTSGPGRDLIADSRLIWTYDGSGYVHGYQLYCNNTPNVASDGITLVCGASGEPQRSVRVPSKCSAMWDNTMGFLAYSTAAPKLARPLYIDQTTCTSEVTAEVLWSSPSGSAMLVWLNSAAESDPAGPQTNVVGMVEGGEFTRIPFPLNGGAAIPNQVAW